MRPTPSRHTECDRLVHMLVGLRCDIEDAKSTHTPPEIVTYSPPGPRPPVSVTLIDAAITVEQALTRVHRRITGKPTPRTMHDTAAAIIAGIPTAEDTAIDTSIDDMQAVWDKLVPRMDHDTPVRVEPRLTARTMVMKLKRAGITVQPATLRKWAQRSAMGDRGPRLTVVKNRVGQSTYLPSEVMAYAKSVGVDKTTPAA